MTGIPFEFDAEVSFANGGGLQMQGFRLDIFGEDISGSELAVAIVRLWACC
jgi:arylformamidase